MKATKGHAAEVQSAAKARENGSASGVQPEAPRRATHPYREVRERNALMSHSATTATAPSTPTISASPTAPTPADEMIGRIHTAFLDKVIAALPDSITAATKKTLPDLCTPELAAELAKDIAARLREAARIEGHVDRIMVALREMEPEATA